MIYAIVVRLNLAKIHTKIWTTMKFGVGNTRKKNKQGKNMNIIKIWCNNNFGIKISGNYLTTFLALVDSTVYVICSDINQFY